MQQRTKENSLKRHGRGILTSKAPRISSESGRLTLQAIKKTAIKRGFSLLPPLKGYQFINITLKLIDWLWAVALTLGRTCKFIPPPWYEGWRWIDPPPPPRVFDMLQYFETILPSVESLWSFLQDKGRILYRWWRCWGACDVTNNGRRLGRYFGFYQELEIRREKWWFFVMEMKNNTRISTLHDFSHMIYFYCWKKLKKHVLLLKKMAWPPLTYDVISRYHRNWPWLNLTHNAHERWTNSYRKHFVLMFYPLGEKSDHPPPRTSEG